MSEFFQEIVNVVAPVFYFVVLMAVGVGILLIGRGSVYSKIVRTKSEERMNLITNVVTGLGVIALAIFFLSRLFK
ncbi:hypothetical protein KKA00_03115 [bacterium]|nr:hypothetical protein [bacterium]MBU1651186.1 hypothetical protein [bacterium]